MCDCCSARTSARFQTRSARSSRTTTTRWTPFMTARTPMPTGSRTTTTAFFAQRYVVAVVKVQAVNAVFAVCVHMRIALHQAAEPRAQLVIIGVGNLVFAFVPIVFFFLHICVSPPGYGYRIQFLPKSNLNAMCLFDEKNLRRGGFGDTAFIKCAARQTSPTKL